MKSSMKIIYNRTPDGRPVTHKGGPNRSATLFRWLARAVTGAAHPTRGTVASRTGLVTFHHNWKGGPRRITIYRDTGRVEVTPPGVTIGELDKAMSMAFTPRKRGARHA